MTQKSPRTRIYATNAGHPQLALTDDDSLGVRRTLRLQPGDWIACFNGDGNEYLYSIADSSRDCMNLSLESCESNPCDDIPPTLVLIAATKGKTKDRMVRDLPPLGVSRIVFYRADRSICQPQLDAQPRLQKIAIEACRQCGRSTIPDVMVIDSSLPDVFENEGIDASLTILFYEQSQQTDDWKQNEYRENAALIFGPEGGFSNEEIEWFRSINIPVASLGQRILRAELAVVVGTTLMQSHRGLLG